MYRYVPYIAILNGKLGSIQVFNSFISGLWTTLTLLYALKNRLFLYFLLSSQKEDSFSVTNMFLSWILRTSCKDHGKNVLNPCRWEQKFRVSIWTMQKKFFPFSVMHNEINRIDVSLWWHKCLSFTWKRTMHRMTQKRIKICTLMFEWSKIPPWK